MTMYTGTHYSTSTEKGKIPLHLSELKITQHLFVTNFDDLFRNFARKNRQTIVIYVAICAETSPTLSKFQMLTC